MIDDATKLVATCEAC
jgi:hypothetical protein